MRKRSKYRPRGVIIDTISHVCSGFRKAGTLPGIGVDLKIKNHQALDSLMRGEGTRDHIEVLIAALNMAEAMYCVNPALGAEWSPEIRDAQDALYNMSRRGLKNNKFMFYAPEMMAIRKILELHDVQLDNCTVKEMEQALYYVQSAIKHNKTRRIDADI